MAEPDDQESTRPSAHTPDRDERTGRPAAAARIAQPSSWVDQQVRRAMERGEFDNLPGHGKPIKDLGSQHDPDWWIKKLVERENIALLPPALALRKEDAGLEDLLDSRNAESVVRREVEDFNVRIRTAMYTPPTGPSGPPLITHQRDVDAEVAAWRERRTARIEAQRALRAAEPEPEPRRSWWRRRRSS